MHQQRQEDLGEPIAAAEDVHDEHTNKQDKQNVQDTRCPLERFACETVSPGWLLVLGI